MNNKIQNIKTETPAGLNLNDKDYIALILTILKNMEKNYVVALTESSNEQLYEKIFNNFNSIAIMQRKVYELMFRKGWYSLEKADSTKISEKYQTLLNEYQTLTINNEN